DEYEDEDDEYEDEDDEYEDEDDEYEDEDDEYEDEDDEYEDEDDGIIVRFKHFLTDMSSLDMVVAMLGIVVLAGVIVTGGLYVNAKAVEKQVEAFASVGEEIEGISVIGESGLLAVAESAKLSNMIGMDDVEGTVEEEQQPEEVQSKTIEVALNLTSIQSDIKIKFVNKATGKLIGGVPFEVEVTGGKTTLNYQDDDKDGIIYKTEIPAGTYNVTVKPLAGDAYKDYMIPTAASSVQVTDTISYKKVDVADEVKTEAEVNVAAEDTAVQDTVVESTLKDTVEWVESTKTPVGDAKDGYEEVPKANIPDPLTTGSAYRKMVEGDGQRSEGEPTVPGGDTTSSGGSTTTDPDSNNPPAVDPAPDNPNPAPTITLDPSSVTLKKGDSTTLTATVTGADAGSVQWQSADSSIASVSGGTVTAVGAGTTTITATAGSVSATCSVTVTEDPKPEINVKISLNQTALTLKKGATASLTATVEPSGSPVQWQSSNTSVATVSGGTVTAVGAGSATISATVTADGKTQSASCTVTVTEDAKPTVTIALDQANLAVKKGATAALKATVSGVNNPSITWASDNTSVATVSGGTVTAVAEGNATITASVAANGTSYSAACTVTVQAVDRKVTISGPTEVAVSKTITLTVQTEPKGTKVRWGSSDEKIAKVDANGVVQGVAEGKVNIVAHLEGDINTNAVYTVTVKKDTSATAKLKDKDGNQMYYKDAAGVYQEATYADYKTQSVFYKKTEVFAEYKYTGWQTIDGYVYFFDKNNNYVTGEQVIQGAKYNFGSDGKMSSGSGTMGIDVSKWNGSIDWNAVKNSGVSYVIIRCGYRGSSTGALIEDPLFRSNIKGAKAAGLKVGVYFFSQAVNEVEAVEEASMAVNLCSGYGLNYPIFLDVESSGGRGDAISKETRTAVCKAFCATVQNSGYSAGVYANKTWFTEKINTGSLTGYKIWLAQYASAPTYSATRYDMWQYSSKGKVSGISGSVDMNISYMSY
ncbi:MAG: Ig-like domain-containing protein, partial [Lachnospiraceae bacterium]|nr:Ig-like domain-containing protein [Lachnospiraceae bacterium]